MAPARKRATASPNERPNLDVASEAPKPTPKMKLDDMVRERIDALEADKRALHGAADALREMIAGMHIEAARIRGDHHAETIRLHTEIADHRARIAGLDQALKFSGTLNGIATAFMAGGGGMVSYASFVAGASAYLANAGVVTLVGGVVVMIAAMRLGGRDTPPKPPR